MLKGTSGVMEDVVCVKIFFFWPGSSFFFFFFFFFAVIP